MLQWTRSRMTKEARLPIRHCLQLLGLERQFTPPHKPGSLSRSSAAQQQEQRLRSLAPKDVKAAYRARVLQLHPDLVAAQQQEAQAASADVGEAASRAPRMQVQNASETFAQLQGAVATLLAAMREAQARDGGDAPATSEAARDGSVSQWGFDVNAEMRRVLDEHREQQQQHRCASSVTRCDGDDASDGSVMEQLSLLVHGEAQRASRIEQFVERFPRALARGAFRIAFEGVVEGNLEPLATFMARLEREAPTIVHRVQKARRAAEGRHRRRRSGHPRDQGRSASSARASGAGIQRIAGRSAHAQQLKSISEVSHIKPLLLMGVVEIDMRDGRATGEDAARDMSQAVADGSNSGRDHKALAVVDAANTGRSDDAYSQFLGSGHLRCVLNPSDTLDEIVRKLGDLEQDSFYVYQRHHAMILSLEVFFEHNRIAGVPFSCFRLICAPDKLDRYVLACENIAIGSLSEAAPLEAGMVAEGGHSVVGWAGIDELAEDAAVALPLISMLTVLPPIDDHSDTFGCAAEIGSFGTSPDDATHLPAELPSKLLAAAASRTVDQDGAATQQSTGTAPVSPTPPPPPPPSSSSSLPGEVPCGVYVRRSRTCCDITEEKYDLEVRLHAAHGIFRARVLAALREVRLQHLVRCVVIPPAVQMRCALLEEEILGDDGQNAMGASLEAAAEAAAERDRGPMFSFPPEDELGALLRSFTGSAPSAMPSGSSPVHVNDGAATVASYATKQHTPVQHSVAVSSASASTKAALSPAVTGGDWRRQRWRRPITCFARLEAFDAIAERCFWEYMFSRREAIASSIAIISREVGERALRSCRALDPDALVGPFKVVLAGRSDFSLGSDSAVRDVEVVDSAADGDGEGELAAHFYDPSGPQVVPLPLATLVPVINTHRLALGLRPLIRRDVGEEVADPASVEDTEAELLAWFQEVCAWSACANAARHILAGAGCTYVSAGDVVPTDFLAFVERYVASAARSVLEAAFRRRVGHARSSSGSGSGSAALQEHHMFNLSVGPEGTRLRVSRGLLCVPHNTDMSQLAQFIDAPNNSLLNLSHS